MRLTGHREIDKLNGKEYRMEGMKKMKIVDLLNNQIPTLSFEVFPPKTGDDYASIEKAIVDIAELKPSYMSVTYGAGGGTSRYTADIASKIKNDYGVVSLAHLTCVSSTKEEIRSQLEELKLKKVENILALRGDIIEGMEFPSKNGYTHACELIEEIRAAGDFCVGGACYPEGHPEASTKDEDILYLKMKVDAGCDFLTTQMFFDNNILYNFLYRIREKGITVPVVAGIMPVVNGRQIKKICALSGTQLPPRFRAIVDKFGSNAPAMKQAGIAYATEQIVDLLANGIRAVHVYSMNKPDIAARIQSSLTELIGK